MKVFPFFLVFLLFLQACSQALDPSPTTPGTKFSCPDGAIVESQEKCNLQFCETTQDCNFLDCSSFETATKAQTPRGIAGCWGYHPYCDTILPGSSYPLYGPQYTEGTKVCICQPTYCT